MGLKFIVKMIGVGFLFFSTLVRAEVPVHPIAAKKNSESGFQEEIQERAKRRIYPGGQDETDLKVQVQVLSPNRKVAPVVEDTSEPVSDD